MSFQELFLMHTISTKKKSLPKICSAWNCAVINWPQEIADEAMANTFTKRIGFGKFLLGKSVPCNKLYGKKLNAVSIR